MFVGGDVMVNKVLEEVYIEGCISRYCFPCLSGICPFGMDFMTDCYPRLASEQRSLFDELFVLRAEIARHRFRSLQVIVLFQNPLKNKYAEL